MTDDTSNAFTVEGDLWITEQDTPYADVIEMDLADGIYELGEMIANYFGFQAEHKRHGGRYIGHVRVTIERAEHMVEPAVTGDKFGEAVQPLVGSFSEALFLMYRLMGAPGGPTREDYERWSDEHWDIANGEEDMA